MRSPRAARSAIRRGVTLLELACAILVISIVGGVSLPLVLTAGDNYAQSAVTRRTAENAAFALDRTVRLLRDVPRGASGGTVGIASASPGAVRFDDGRGVDLAGTTLSLRGSSGVAEPLCEGVQAFTITYLGKDGVTSTLAAPDQTQRFGVAITVNGLELRTAVLAGARVGNP